MTDTSRLNIERAGDGGSDIVFLHGFMGSTADWGAVRDAFAAEHRCWFVDLPGHGASVGRLADEPMGVETVADVVATELRAAGLQSAHLVGYSMGGRIGLALALRHPDFVDRLVLESTSPGISEPDERQKRARQDDERARRIRAEGLEAFLDDWYDLPLFETFRTHPRFEDALERRLAGDADALARVIRQMSPGRQPDLWPRLPDLDLPVLLVTGADDPKYPDVVRRTADDLPDPRRAIADRAGHNVHFERPDWYARLLLDFLQDDFGSPWRRGLRQLADGQFWEAHESWEAIWQQLPESRARERTQALIQFAAACYKVRQVDGGRPADDMQRGMQGLIERADGHLTAAAQLGPPDVAWPVDALDRAFARLTDALDRWRRTGDLDAVAADTGRIAGELATSLGRQPTPVTSRQR